jgi:hypothetical protein
LAGSPTRAANAFGGDRFRQGPRSCPGSLARQGQARPSW